MATRMPQTAAEQELFNLAFSEAEKFLAGQRIFDPEDDRQISLVASVGDNQRMIREIREAQKDAEDNRAFREFKRMARCNQGVRL